jgi:hypothetical protein
MHQNFYFVRQFTSTNGGKELMSETLSLKMQAIDQKLQDLKKSDGYSAETDEGRSRIPDCKFQKLDKGDQGGRIDKRASAC